MAPTLWALRVIGRPPRPAMTGRPAPAPRHTDWRSQTSSLSPLDFLEAAAAIACPIANAIDSEKARPSAGKQQVALLRHIRSPRFSFSYSVRWQARRQSLDWLRPK